MTLSTGKGIYASLREQNFHSQDTSYLEITTGAFQPLINLHVNKPMNADKMCWYTICASILACLSTLVCIVVCVAIQDMLVAL